MSSTPMYKTTVVIWTTENPDGVVELSDLAEQASEGDAYASSQVTVAVEPADLGADPDATDGMLAFFEIDPPFTDAAPSPGPNDGPRVMAELVRDGQADGIFFDATAWFETATTVELRDLINCNFGGDYPADAVANHFRDLDDEVTEVLDLCDDMGSGFEVHVEPIGAIAWIAAHRPDDMLTLAIREWKNLA